ncbi:MAG: type II secretion system F family protein [Candidatus Nanopusillus sp.]|nr:type II secretion system F family protein [Candidatus Nanopusillus sp.]MCG2882776.1 type II secretion system F family protein [Candidatus Nanopusillus sp.]
MITNTYNKRVNQKGLIERFIDQIFNIKDPLHYKEINVFGSYIKEDRFILYISILFASIIGIFGIIFKLYENYIALSILIIVIYLVGGVPYLFYKYIESKIYENISNNYTYFLSYLSESLSSGMTLLDALAYLSSIDLGYLSILVKKLYNWIAWGMPFEKAFTLFNMYFEELPNIKMINYVILETYKGGGDISKVLKRLYNDLESVKELDGLKRAYISQQILVLYAIFIIFVGLSISILDTIKPLIISQISVSTIHTAFNFFSSQINYSWLKFITSLSIIMVGISASIIMGIAESGKLRSSVKHLAINNLIGLLSIVIFVLPSFVSFNLQVFPTTAYVYTPINIQVYGYIDTQPITNAPLTIYVINSAGNYVYQNFQILQNGYYSQSIELNSTGTYIVEAILNYNGKKYIQKQSINVTI